MERVMELPMELAGATREPPRVLRRPPGSSPGWAPCWQPLGSQGTPTRGRVKAGEPARGAMETQGLMLGVPAVGGVARHPPILSESSKRASARMVLCVSPGSNCAVCAASESASASGPPLSTLTAADEQWQGECASARVLAGGAAGGAACTLRVPVHTGWPLGERERPLRETTNQGEALRPKNSRRPILACTY